jgi:hypothetical protein
MEAPGMYDTELQMFREPAHDPELVVLRFWRWLAELGHLEHAVAGPPIGAYAGVEEA